MSWMLAAAVGQGAVLAMRRRPKLDARTSLVAPCGLDCGVCAAYHCKDDPKLLDSLVAHGLPREALPCAGCMTGGRCPGIAGTCATLACARERGVRFCCDCEAFPCLHLAPAASGAATLPHNTKLYNLCVLACRGVEALTQESAHAKRLYYAGKLKLGAGPGLEEASESVGENGQGERKSANGVAAIAGVGGGA